MRHWKLRHLPPRKRTRAQFGAVCESGGTFLSRTRVIRGQG